MDDMDVQELYDLIKKHGFKAEKKLNELIQQAINKENIIESVSKHSSAYAKLMKQLQEIIEVSSIPLNFPTKNDVANVAKLVIQTEEKLESIEEKLFTISKQLDEIQYVLEKETDSQKEMASDTKTSFIKDYQKQHRKRVSTLKKPEKLNLFFQDPMDSFELLSSYLKEKSSVKKNGK